MHRIAAFPPAVSLNILALLDYLFRLGQNFLENFVQSPSPAPSYLLIALFAALVPRTPPKLLMVTPPLPLLVL